jgi:hypothetical protein
LRNEMLAGAGLRSKAQAKQSSTDEARDVIAKRPAARDVTAKMKKNKTGAPAGVLVSDAAAASSGTVGTCPAAACSENEPKFYDEMEQVPAMMSERFFEM